LDTLRQACAVEERSPLGVWAAADGSGPDTLSQGCVEQLGALIRLDWDSFHATPAAVGQPETTLEHLIWGAHTLVASDVGTVAELDAAMQKSELLKHEYGGSWRGARVRPDDEAAEWWLEHYADHVAALRWDERDDCTI
jgi:hypothetical protein